MYAPRAGAVEFIEHFSARNIVPPVQKLSLFECLVSHTKAKEGGAQTLALFLTPKKGEDSPHIAVLGALHIARFVSSTHASVRANMLRNSSQ